MISPLTLKKSLSLNFSAGQPSLIIEQQQITIDKQRNILAANANLLINENDDERTVSENDAKSNFQ